MEASVLIVEDESIVALDIKTRLLALGLDVVGYAQDSSTAIRLAGEERPDVILMDIQIAGETDGIETAGIIGERYDIPSIFLTAYSDRRSLERAKQVRGYGYLLKPFQERELMIAIEMALFKHNAERELRTSRTILSTTINTIDEGVMTTADDNSVLLMNRAAERLTGWPVEEALGRPIDEVLVVSEPDIPEKDYYRWNDRGRENPFGSVLVVPRAGASFPADVTRISIESRRGSPESCVVVIRDVTALIEYRKNLIDARNAAESAARVKSEFMARMSHEFRTPLNTILGMIRLAMENTPETDTREYLEISHSSAREMMNLVTDLLDYSSHDTGDTPLRQEKFSLPDVVRSAVLAYAPNAARKGIRLAVVTDPSLPERVIGDPQRLRRVLVNLVSNAVKFTDSGSVVVDAESREAGGGSTVTVTVEDTGVGIPEEKLEEAFGAFSQLQDSRTRTAGGTGLGLAIARRTARAMNGDIAISSRADGGTLARCRVQLQVPDRDEPEGPDELRDKWLGETRIIAASDPIVRRVVEPWTRWKNVPFPYLDDPMPANSIPVMSMEEYRRRGDYDAGRTICVVGPIGGSGELAEIPSKRLLYLPEPLTFRELVACLAAGRVDSETDRVEISPGHDGTVAALQRLREMLHNESSEQVLEYIRACRSGDLPAHESEVLFRVSLALRKHDISGAGVLLDRAIRQHRF